MTESLPEALSEIVRETAKAGTWERDRKAWNLPRPVAAGPSRTADRQLEWQAFSAAFYPSSRRHNLGAIVAYGEYRRTGAEPTVSRDSRPLHANGAVRAWEDEGGATA